MNNKHFIHRTLGHCLSSIWFLNFCLACFFLISVGELQAQEINRGADEDPTEFSLEELINIKVTSVGKKETSLEESPAAISVITQEDIRRSGHTSIPELLRMIPGLNVARINANEWAITSRGFNNQYATKLLVLVDGRSVYSPMFAGVYWNAQDTMIEDVDRIEVIRGPGAALWGANAVNGVINITTKSAKETQGGLVTTTYGTEDRPSTSIRYGGQLASNLYYRAYVKYFDREGFIDAPGQGGADDWEAIRGGLRLDWEPMENDILTLQGEYYSASVGEHFERVSLTPPLLQGENLVHHNNGANVLGRWRHEFSDESDVTIQSYYDHFHQGDGDVVETRDTFDFDLQNRFLLGNRNDIVWGVGYRYTKDHLPPSFYLTFFPERQEEHLYNIFLQDEITLVQDRLKLTLGSKLEHNDHTGFEVQPSARLLWTPTERQTVWSSVSRAVRTPARYDRGSRLNSAVSKSPSSPPFLVSLFQGPDVKSEELIAYELGYRIEATKRLSIDLAGFYNEYDRLLSYVPGPVVFENNPAPPHLLLPLHFENVLSGVTYGTEFSATWAATDDWKFIAGYTWLHMRMHPDESVEEENPQHQFHLRSYLDLPYDLQLNGAVYYVSQIMTPRDNDRIRVDPYLRLDLGLTWRPTESLEIGIWGQNLLENRHQEFGSFKTATPTEIPRSVYGKVTWRF